MDSLSPPQPAFHSSKPKNFPPDASFSASLKPGPDPKPAGSRFQCEVEDAEISIFDAQKYFNEGGEEDRNQDGHKKDHTNRAASPPAPAFRRLPSVSSAEGYGRNYRSSTRCFRSTPTASSEASWNSQAGLLSNPPGAIAVHLRNVTPPPDEKRRSSGNGSSPKWLFRLKCPCAGKKSVQVEEKLPDSNNLFGCSPSFLKRTQNPNPPGRVCGKACESKFPTNSSITRDLARRPGLIQALHHEISPESEPSHRAVASVRPFVDAPAFSFPILGPPPPMKLVPNKGLLPNIIDSREEEEEGPSRHSLEVFRPREPQKDRRSSGLPPASPKSLTTVTTTTDDHYDGASDASSDLFEIESFPTQPSVLSSAPEASVGFSNRRLAAAAYGGELSSRRQSLDGTMTPSSAVPTECYEPSEASIDWSVTTAEGFGFDRGSVASFSGNCTDQERTKNSNSGSNTNNNKRRGMMNGGGGLLMMSCRWEKAVSVGPRPLRFPADLGHVGGGGSAAAAVGHPKPPLAKSHSARLSLPFVA